MIVDEVLSVGDFRFQEKCEKRIREMIGHGVTIILVSHDSKLIKEMCSQVIWLEHGAIRKMGSTESICDEYEKSE